MTETELIAILKTAYHQARERKVVLSIHLFGTEYAEQLKGHKIQDICQGANVPASYGTEIRKGIRLAQYVQLRSK